MEVGLDRRLVSGFHFGCLPGCGLCCYTTPAVAPAERVPLIQLDPTTPLIEGSEGWSRVASRPEGGACYFLREGRCTCHAVRPATCAEFPLTVHVGDHAQVSVVLTCPGVDLTLLERWGSRTPPTEMSPDLGRELEAVTRELSRAQTAGQLRWAAQRRHGLERKLRRAGIWQPEEEVRTLLRDHLDRLVPTELYSEEVPDEESPLAALPMFFDPQFGRVAWRPHPAGVEFLSLSEAGGIQAHLGVLASPRRSPGLTEDARAMLRGYLGYLLERDATIAVAYVHLLEADEGLPDQLVAEDLAATAGQVLRSATLRRTLTSDRQGALTRDDVERGIRATDMDILDRPTGGLRL